MSIEEQLRKEADGVYGWSNGPGDRYARHTHPFTKILYPSTSRSTPVVTAVRRSTPTATQLMEKVIRVVSPFPMVTVTGLGAAIVQFAAAPESATVWLPRARFAMTIALFAPSGLVG